MGADWLPDIQRARLLVVDALLCDDRRERYLCAHRAAAHAADAAMLARTGHRLPEELPDPWQQVARRLPVLAEWATHFAAMQPRRDAVVRGRLLISQREADDMVRDADSFCEVVISWVQRPAHEGRRAG